MINAIFNAISRLVGRSLKHEFVWECCDCGYRFYGRGANVHDASRDIDLQRQMHHARTGHLSYQLKQGDQQ